MILVRFALGLIALSGCGLISSNATTYDLDLPAKSFSVDASGWQVTQTAAEAYLTKTCDTQPRAVRDGSGRRVPDELHGELRRGRPHLRSRARGRRAPDDRSAEREARAEVAR